MTTGSDISNRPSTGGQTNVMTWFTKDGMQLQKRPSYLDSNVKEKLTDIYNPQHNNTTHGERGAVAKEHSPQ